MSPLTAAQVAVPDIKLVFQPLHLTSSACSQWERCHPIYSLGTLVLCLILRDTEEDILFALKMLTVQREKQAL